MPDDKAALVKSARGHVATFEELAERERKRLAEGGPYPASELVSRDQLAFYEARVKDWKALLKKAEQAASEASD